MTARPLLRLVVAFELPRRGPRPPPNSGSRAASVDTVGVITGAGFGAGGCAATLIRSRLTGFGATGFGANDPASCRRSGAFGANDPLSCVLTTGAGRGANDPLSCRGATGSGARGANDPDSCRGASSMTSGACCSVACGVGVTPSSSYVPAFVRPVRLSTFPSHGRHSSHSSGASLIITRSCPESTSRSRCPCMMACDAAVRPIISA